MECGMSQILRHESNSGHQQKEQVSDKLTSYGILLLFLLEVYVEHVQHLQ